MIELKCCICNKVIEGEDPLMIDNYQYYCSVDCYKEKDDEDKPVLSTTNQVHPQPTDVS